MRLELASFLVREVKFGKKTNYHQGLLEINRSDLLSLVLSDNKVATADLALAFPEDRTRIVRIQSCAQEY